MEKVFKVFVDFDGTITRKDIGDAVFTKFGHTAIVKQVIEDLLSDRISARDCWLKLCQSVDYIEKIDEINNRFPAGENSVTFSAINRQAGIYFYKFESGDFVEVKKMVLTN